MRTLDEAKALVRNEALGRAGVHGVGLLRSENAVVVFVHNETPEQQLMFERLRARVSPYEIQTVHEMLPQLA